MKKGPLWIVCPSPSFATIPSEVFERVPTQQKALEMEIGNSHSLTSFRMCLHTLQAANYTAARWQVACLMPAENFCSYEN